MLSVMEREMVRQFYLLTRPLNNFTRSRAFAKTEPSGTDMTGSWDQTILQRNDVGAYQQASKVHTFIDNHQSKGSFVVDVNGNVLLDLCSTETLPLGHNPDAFVKAVTSGARFDANIINASLDAMTHVDGDFADRASDVLDSLAPKGLPNVTFAGMNNAVEQAIFAAMRERGQDSHFTALGFEGSFRGTSMVLNQFSHPGKALSLGWPSVKYP
mgnify:CR=1 FL=1